MTAPPADRTTTSSAPVPPRPRRRSRARRARGSTQPVLVTALVLAVVLAVVITVARGAYRDGLLEPDAPTPQGSRAVVSVLEDRGTAVETVRHTADAAADLREGATVLVTDPSSLSARQLTELESALAEGEGRLVLVRPDFVTLSYLEPGVVPAGEVPASDQPVSACPALDHRATQLRTLGEDGATGPSLRYRASGAATACIPSGDAALVAGSPRVLVLGSADVLSNDGVGEADNAALALAALGTTSRTSWYVPSPSDPLASSAPSIVSHLPGWSGPLALWIAVLALVAVSAAARRAGPVVVEPLPVSVRPQELVRGRARLLQRSRSQDAAARALRAAAGARIADHLGLRRETTLDALLAALAPRVSGPGRSPQQLRELLGPTPVPDDRRLVELARDLDRLEKEIDR